MLPSILILVPVFLPIICGAILLALPNISRKARNIFSFTVAVVNFLLVLTLILCGGRYELEVFELMDGLGVAFKMDGLGKFFALMVSALSPLSLLYGFEYMEDEERQDKFFAFFTMTLGSVLGIALAKDIFSMYLFYEILTLLTFPLVMHEMSDEALKAGRQYLTYMLGGASFAFVGIIVLFMNSDSLDFKLGGVAIDQNFSRNVMLFIFVMMFCGFSVKAAIMPFGKWLIKAAVAPMPVTALLHAVAVVKAGAFAVIRLIYYIFGADYLRGSWAQYVVIGLCAMTIIYGSSMAVKEPHLKRRMAYSTISNLSYILFGAAIMTPMGMYASLMHMIAHAVTKIALFFCVGAIMHVTGKCYIYEIDNLGRKMWKTFVFFAMGALSIIGVPQFMGFNSKISLLRAAIDGGSAIDYVGAFAIIFSALMTAIYLLGILLRAFFPAGNAKCERYDECHDPGWKMLVPIGIAAVSTLLFGIWWEPISQLIQLICGIPIYRG